MKEENLRFSLSFHHTVCKTGFIYVQKHSEWFISEEKPAHCIS